ncbi:hypothetical protein TEA_018530 [Camellia sinensis var. sinensis]|uniref:Thioesterase domain-containing protein n=1 Tax=Camellia sinensis var. sinensis TaxID=542762 RepID=A0A4S4ENY0_CAMSN|nr:hypothetical protein TEA_018530 [Camellia sinensis var. sinensis]
MLHPGQNKQNIIWTLNRNRTGKEMDLESVKKYLERDGSRNATTIDEMPSKFFEPFVMQGLSIDLLEPGRLICSMIVPPRLLNTGNFLHGGATATLVDIVGSAVIYTVGAPFTGVSVEINVSYLDAAYVGNAPKKPINRRGAYLLQSIQELYKFSQSEYKGVLSNSLCLVTCLSCKFVSYANLVSSSKACA